MLVSQNRDTPGSPQSSLDNYISRLPTLNISDQYQQPVRLPPQSPMSCLMSSDCPHTQLASLGLRGRCGGWWVVGGPSLKYTAVFSSQLIRVSITRQWPLASPALSSSLSHTPLEVHEVGLDLA